MASQAEKRAWKWTLFGLSALVYQSVIGYPVKVSGASMEPTLKGGTPYKWFSPGDIVWLSRVKRHNPKRGDVVVYPKPYDHRASVIKRVIALPGDVIVTNGNYIPIPYGHVWTEGDNDAASIDSRSYGPVPLSLIKGIVRTRLYPNPGRVPDYEKPEPHTKVLEPFPIADIAERWIELSNETDDSEK